MRVGIEDIRRKIHNDGLLSFIKTAISEVYNLIKNYILKFGDETGLIGPDEIYGREYYKMRRGDPYRSEAHSIAYVLREEFNPSSVIDFGCAIGAYLEPFYESDVDIQGVEGNKSAKEFAVIPKENIEHHDLRELYESEQDYDLVLSIEVAEHLPSDSADTFVDTLTSAGSTVVMTAAQPGQGGTHHINEQPRSYWIQKFEKRDFTYKQESVESLRENIEADAFSHVPKNIFVFEKSCSEEFDSK